MNYPTITVITARLIADHLRTRLHAHRSDPYALAWELWCDDLVQEALSLSVQNWFSKDTHLLATFRIVSDRLLELRSVTNALLPFTCETPPWEPNTAVWASTTHSLTAWKVSRPDYAQGAMIARAVINRWYTDGVLDSALLWFARGQAYSQNERLDMLADRVSICDGVDAAILYSLLIEGLIP